MFGLSYKETTDPFPGERHLPGHNYTGTGTRVIERKARGDQPVNRVDAASRLHDMEYEFARGQVDRKKLVQQADRDYINTNFDIIFGRRDSSLRERVDAALVIPIISTQFAIRAITGMDYQTLRGWDE